MMCRLPLLFLILAWAFPVQASEPRLVGGERAFVSSVVDGDTVVLRDSIEGMTQIRLVGLQAPKLPLGRRGFKAWPLGEDSKSTLESLVLGQAITLKFGGRRSDRHGRILAHLFLNDGGWVQGEMLRRGMARVYSFPDNRAEVAKMLALERAARTKRQGIWDHPFYAVRKVKNLHPHIGTFQVIEGQVLDVAKVKSRVYLNFGDNWRTDFTVTLSSKVFRLFKKAGMDPMAFKDQSIRVRGWLRKRNGPMIQASHPEQAELLK